MWWHDKFARSRFVRLAGVVAMAALVAGCFQPLYGERVVGGPGLRDALSTVDVSEIAAKQGTDEARVAVEVRNSLLYDLTGNNPAPLPHYRLRIAMSSTRADIIVDVTTTRPAIENYGINASYTLTEITTGRQVIAGQTFARVSYDVPGQEQRFARLRGLRDAESRAAKVIADNIRDRLASYFVAGT
jgi:LPS-assembly lipoprotein